MIAVLGLLFLVLPIAELYVILQVSHGIGVLNTIGVLILVSVVGAWLCKREGIGVWRRLQAAIDRRQLPHRELVDGALILLAGALLLTPGFLTDCLGVLLLLPPTRVFFRSIVLGVVGRGHPAAMVVRRVVDTTGSERP